MTLTDFLLLLILSIFTTYTFMPWKNMDKGSKRKIGRPLQCSKTLSLLNLNGIIEYLPSELYIKVKAGTPIKKIQEELKKKNKN